MTTRIDDGDHVPLLCDCDTCRAEMAKRPGRVEAESVTDGARPFLAKVQLSSLHGVMLRPLAEADDDE
jgi:hypothetical protein